MSQQVSREILDRREDLNQTLAPAVQRFEEVAGSLFLGLFGVALFDQTMLPGVSAALEATGRIQFRPWQRAARTGASDQLVLLGDDLVRGAESERLKRLHAEVRGVGSDGTRYSALNPELWNWILISTFFVHHHAYITLTGDRPSAADNQAIWDYYRRKADGLQLPGRSRLIEDYEELVEYYDAMVAEKLQQTTILTAAAQLVRRPPAPDFMPSAVVPVWKMGGPVIGHVAGVLGCGIMHPGVRALMPMTWSRRHELEFQILSTILRFGYQWLPSALTEVPMARNRRQYQRLVSKYRRIGLQSFAPDRHLGL
ncbi:oxygenase MpaB family protein [Nocardia sp. NPDC059764]|uniref:oxygenase MpaB family protein n=1 Tax=Nocardia sp. NPDC059764 TaxID=3346939 RepID=UPI003648887E